VAIKSPVVSADGIVKYFDDHQVLGGCSLDVNAGQTVCIVGRSGSGKSTFLRCLNFLEEPSAGSVTVDGITIQAAPHHTHRRGRQRQIHELRIRVGMLFQEFNLFPHLRVIDNLIEAPMRVKKMARAEATELAETYLAKVGLSDKRNEFPSRLSGGQKQRAAIARALTMSPKLLLFDEPTSALDPELVGEVLKVMAQLASEGSTMIVVTHEMAFAREAADAVYFMESGTFIESGPPSQVLDRPSDPRTRQFLDRFLSSPSRGPRL
jgi:polar amino acid transport system ATP-binding protein